MSIEKAYPEERLIKITELVKKNRTVTVDQLAKMFGITGATIRADLRTLESRGIVSRTHGGAILREFVDAHLKMDEDPVYQSRLSHFNREKEAIGAACASYLNGVDCIYMDDGTTTLFVARSLPHDCHMTVITNGLNCCNELAAHPSVSVICTGGTLTRDNLAFNGRVAEDIVCRFNASYAVLGASGITPLDGLTAPDEQRAELKKRMIEKSAKTIIVADHSKLTRVSLVPVCEISRIDVLITDWNAPSGLLDDYRAQGIEVIAAQPVSEE